MKSKKSKSTASDISFEYIYDSDGNIIITGGPYDLTELIIPDELDGHKIVGIADNALQHSRLIRTLSIGAYLKDIGKGAFYTGHYFQRWWAEEGRYCRISVNGKNPYFFVENDALYRRADDGTYELIIYAGEDESVVVKEGTSEIRDEAFAATNVQELTIPSTVKKLGKNVIDQCYGLKYLILDSRLVGERPGFTRIHIPYFDQSDWYSGADTEAHDEALSCFKKCKNGTLFDFEKYDNIFNDLKNDEDKAIFVALCRLDNPVKLSSNSYKEYEAFLAEREKYALRMASEMEDAYAMKVLGKRLNNRSKEL